MLTNTVVITIDVALLVVTALLLLLSISRNRRQSGTVSYITLCTLAFFWVLSDVFYHASTSEKRATFYMDIQAALGAFVVAFLLVFILRYYQIDKRVGLTPALFCVMPAVTAVLVLTDPWYGLFYKRFQIIRLVPLVRAIKIPGIWFWINAIYGYLVFLAAALLLVYQVFHLPKIYRQPAVLMLGGTGLAGVFIALANTLWQNTGFDATFLGTVLMLILFYAGMVRGEKSDFLVLAHHEIFHSMEDRIFILNRLRRVIDANRAARDWMQQLAVEEEAPLLEDVVAHLTAADFIPQAMGGDNFRVYLTYQPQLAVYQMREQTVTGRRGEPVGIFVTFTDVTRYRLLMDKLEQTMGIDPLTGLGNRHRYLQAITELDQPDLLPLAVVVGDVNGLKTVNDTYGHLAGDRLLQICGRAMEHASPAAGRVFRIGGDEFVCLLPQSDEDAAREYLARLEEALAASDPGLLPAVSMALGVSVKTRPEEEYSDIFRRADQTMYRKKEYDRRTGPPDRRTGPPDRRNGPD